MGIKCNVTKYKKSVRYFKVEELLLSHLAVPSTAISFKKHLVLDNKAAADCPSYTTPIRCGLNFLHPPSFSLILLLKL